MFQLHCLGSNIADGLLYDDSKLRCRSLAVLLVSLSLLCSKTVIVSAVQARDLPQVPRTNCNGPYDSRHVCSTLTRGDSSRCWFFRTRDTIDICGGEGSRGDENRSLRDKKSVPDARTAVASDRTSDNDARLTTSIAASGKT